jgi:hypothetical protein
LSADEVLADKSSQHALLDEGAAMLRGAFHAQDKQLSLALSAYQMPSFCSKQMEEVACLACGQMAGMVCCLQLAASCASIAESRTGVLHFHCP